MVSISEWLSESWIDIFYALVFAIAAALVIDYIYKKIKHEPKILQKTIPARSRKLSAKLLLPNNNEIRISNIENILGREDFLGAISGDDLLYIGKKHFKIIKLEDGQFIEDLNSQNGTSLNGEEIKGSGLKKLNDNDEIMVANILKIRYSLENSSKNMI
ncbi:MAG: FHA domain-containing protein [Candidatus Methanoperedens sp.]|nr:FHA domain-containing protein [Candidatus Methanoperedens sp.]